MDLLDRAGEKGRNKNAPDRMGLFQPQTGKAEALLLAWLPASLSAISPSTLAPVSVDRVYARRVAAHSRHAPAFASHVVISQRPTSPVGADRRHKLRAACTARYLVFI